MSDKNDERDLRSLAEQRMISKHLPPRPSPLETELELHKIELEIQNEELRRLHTEAEEARERSLDLFERSPVGYLALGVDGRIRRANRVFAEMLRSCSEALIGRPLAAFVAAEDADRLHLHLREARTSSRQVTCDLTLEAGERAPIRMISLAVSGVDGIELRCALLDLAPPRPLPSEVRPGAATVLVVDDRAPNRDLVRMTLSGEGYRVLAAANGSEALALCEAERPDCVLLDIRMPDMDGFELCSRIRSLPGGSEIPVLFLTALREVDAFERALSCGAVDFLTKPVQPAELILRVGVALKLRRLGDERDEMYAMLRHQRDDLIRAELQKERMSSFLVHDLKNPASGIWMASKLILGDPHASPRSREIAERIRQEADALLRMLEGLMDIARADEGALRVLRTELDLRSLCAEVREGLVILAESHQIEIRTEIAVETVFADRDLLRRILENLLDNAIRHSPSDAAVTLSAAEREGGVEIRVTDTGPGVPPELRDAIFRRFVQGRSGSSRHGRGLGLAFCKHAVEAHEGRIRVEDTPGGATFAVWLPSRELPRVAATS